LFRLNAQAATKAFQVKANNRVRLLERKARLAERINPGHLLATAAPVLSGSNARYEVAARA